MKRNIKDEVDTFRDFKQQKLDVENDLQNGSSSSTDKNAVSYVENGIYFVKINGIDETNNLPTFALFELISRINPIASIHFNYCIDPDFLIKYILNFLKYYVISQYPSRCRSTPITLITGQNSKADLATRAFKYKNIVVDGAALPFPYGTHHSKLSMFESEDALHIMISTANLISEDYENTNIGYDLLEYLEWAYGGTKMGHKTVNYWISRIKDGTPDFSLIPDRLIGTLPGRYIGAKLFSFGHLKLRKLLSSKFSSAELHNQKTKIAQFSSIGTLGPNPHSWLCDEFLKSLSGANNLKLIFPSVENVRESLEGYEAGLSLPYNSTVNVKQPWLRSMLHKWKSNAIKRSRAMPHIKTYTAIDENTQQPEWLLLTSANLSKSAWGSLEKQQSQLFCRSYELGVLICKKDHQKDFILPYDLPLEKYSSTDQPFLVDYPYQEKDSMGRRRTDLR